MCLIFPKKIQRVKGYATDVYCSAECVTKCLITQQSTKILPYKQPLEAHLEIDIAM